MPSGGATFSGQVHGRFPPRVRNAFRIQMMRKRIGSVSYVGTPGNISCVFGHHAQGVVLIAMGTMKAASLLHQARTAAGLSQAELAQKAGVTQSVISVYEAGRRQPSVPTLTALIAASGFELDLSIGKPRQGA